MVLFNQVSSRLWAWTTGGDLVKEDLPLGLSFNCLHDSLHQSSWLWVHLSFRVPSSSLVVPPFNVCLLLSPLSSKLQPWLISHFIPHIFLESGFHMTLCKPAMIQCLRITYLFIYFKFIFLFLINLFFIGVQFFNIQNNTQCSSRQMPTSMPIIQSPPPSALLPFQHPLFLFQS